MELFKLKNTENVYQILKNGNIYTERQESSLEALCMSLTVSGKVYSNHSNKGAVLAKASGLCCIWYA